MIITITFPVDTRRFYKFKANYTESIKTYIESLSYFERNEFKFMEIAIMFNLGDAYAKAGEYDKAMELNVKFFL